MRPAPSGGDVYVEEATAAKYCLQANTRVVQTERLLGMMALTALAHMNNDSMSLYAARSIGRRRKIPTVATPNGMRTLSPSL